MAYAVEGKDEFVAHKRRHFRLCKKVNGVPTCPCLVATRSNRHIITQMTDDTTGHTLVSASDIETVLVKEVGTKTEEVCRISILVTGRAKAAGITTITFDRGGDKCFSHVTAVAETAREGGLEL